ncbi:ATP-binding protein [Domibacillus epiphyticus]|uniref:histidine kinase n=1 Tax=Domibacillus epiphyticus TaxID=1714355 RepID=A0A1V2AB24_9BACI|nr:ATP-binding protein [Domibacillus epiphyticus]OMP68191.1 hypothetical protein BTO28_02700 [Domibacillus epiphyticus]
MVFFKDEEMKFFLNKIGGNIFILDQDFTIQWSNDYTNNLVNKFSKYINIHSKEELIGKSIGMFLCDIGAQLDILREGPFPYETIVTLFDRYTACIIIDPFFYKGKYNGYVLTLKDVTELENKMTDIQEVIDHSIILAYCDLEGFITSANDKFCELSEYKKDELIGKHFYFLGSNYYSREFYNDIFGIISKGDRWKGELKQRTKNGLEYWIDVTIVPLMEDGKPNQYVVIQHDITSRKKTEELLLRSEKLSVIGELAAGVAHEIRNPLTSIKGFTQLMSTNNEYQKIILDEIDRINVIVSEFMLLAKPHPVHFAPRKIVPLLKHVISLLESEANLKNVQFHFHIKDHDTMVECEEHQLKQVFLNMMKNAMDAMPNGGKITISVRRNKDRVEIGIADEGIGIPQDKMLKIGEPFYSSKENGNGLGLMMSFKIIQNHGGKYHIESQENKGTTFTISLPHC